MKGFRRGRCCAKQMFIVRQICEKYLGKGDDEYFVTLDFKKAYDRVDREVIWSVSRLYGFGGGQASPARCQSQARVNREGWCQEGHPAIKKPLPKLEME